MTTMKLVRGTPHEQPKGGGDGSGSRLVRLRNHLDKYLAVYVAVVIVIGFFLGLKLAPKLHSALPVIKHLELVSIFIMILPMMIMLNLNGLLRAFTKWKILTVVLLMNFIWGPVMAILLGHLFVSSPLVRMGIFLAWLVPCSSMTVGYVGLMRGDIESATALVAITFIVGIPVIPLFAGLYGSMYHMQVSMGLLVMTIVEVILVPLVLGLAIHYFLTKKLGKQKFQKLSPAFSSTTMIGMFMIVFLIFLSNAPRVLKNLHQLLGIFYTAMAFGTISLLFLTFFLKALKVNYWESMATIFPSIGKNEATAIAIASTAFSPLVALPPAIFPIFQIVFLVAFIKLRGVIARFYGVKDKEVEFKSDMVAQH